MPATLMKTQRRPAPHRTSGRRSATDIAYRITDFPMHYFAAIQWYNQSNFARILRSSGLTVPAWRALAALHHKDGQTIGEVAQLAVVDRSSLGRLLDGMARSGLVERTPLPDDRRAVLIRLSIKGRRLFEENVPRVLQHYDKLLKGITPGEFEVLMRVVRRMKANAQMMADPLEVSAQSGP
jgi:MarR family transcriptional regulator, organic hydroperoxide resistance regulator